MADKRRFTSAVAILNDLDVRLVNLITNNPEKAQALRDAGVEVQNLVPVVSDSQNLREYYDFKRDILGHFVGLTEGVTE